MDKIDNRNPVEMDDAKLLEELESEENELDNSEKEKSEEILKKINETDIDEEVEEKVIEKEEKVPEVDYKSKFKASSQEAMILKAKLDAIEAEKNKPIEINEEYMKSHYQDWEDMTATEQRLLMRDEKREQEIKELRAKTNEFNNDRKWEQTITEVIEDPELIENFPSLKGKEEQFKRFCTKPTRKGLPVDTLAAAFLYEFKEEAKPLRTIFKESSSGADKKVVSKSLTPEESAILRKNSNSKYMDMIKNPKYDPLADL